MTAAPVQERPKYTAGYSCPCGGILRFETGEYGQTLEVCDSCHYRGRPRPPGERDNDAIKQEWDKETAAVQNRPGRRTYFGKRGIPELSSSGIHSKREFPDVEISKSVHPPKSVQGVVNKTEGIEQKQAETPEPRQERTGSGKFIVARVMMAAHPDDIRTARCSRHTSPRHERARDKQVKFVHIATNDQRNSGATGRETRNYFCESCGELFATKHGLTIQSAVAPASGKVYAYQTFDDDGGLPDSPENSGSETPVSFSTSSDRGKNENQPADREQVTDREQKRPRLLSSPAFWDDFINELEDELAKLDRRRAIVLAGLAAARDLEVIYSEGWQ